MLVIMEMDFNAKVSHWCMPITCEVICNELLQDAWRAVLMQSPRIVRLDPLMTAHHVRVTQDMLAMAIHAQANNFKFSFLLISRTELFGHSLQNMQRVCSF